MLNETLTSLIDFLKTYNLELKDFVLFLSLVISSLALIWNGFTFALNRNSILQATASQNLIDLQKISINHPYVEDYYFITRWSELKEWYVRHNQDIKLKEDEKYRRILVYEQYCEIIFNFISSEFKRHKGNLNHLNSEIDFEQWAVSHKLWWENSLYIENNDESYNDDLTNVIQFWIFKKELEKLNKKWIFKIINYFVVGKWTRKLFFNYLFNLNKYIKKKYS